MFPLCFCLSVFFPHRECDRSEDEHLCDKFWTCVGHRHGECFSSPPPVFNHQRESSDTRRSSILVVSVRLIKKKKKRKMHWWGTQHFRRVTNKLPFFYLQDDKVSFQRQDCEHLMSAESNISSPLPAKALMCFQEQAVQRPVVKRVLFLSYLCRHFARKKSGGEGPSIRIFFTKCSSKCSLL